MFKKIQRIDERVLAGITVLHSRVNNRIMRSVTALGNFGLIWLILSLPFLLMRDKRIIGANIIFVLGFASLIGEGIIKHLVGRVRPSDSLSKDEQIIKNPKYYSFPSGHTTSSFAVFGVTAIRCGAPIWIPVLVVACLIAFSRIYLRVHYLSDVIVGIVIGLACGFSSVAIIDFSVSRVFGLA